MSGRLTHLGPSRTMSGHHGAEAEVAVVGAGIVGCAAAYYPARRGVQVVVVERGMVHGEQSRKNWGFVRQQGRDLHEGGPQKRCRARPRPGLAPPEV